MMNISTERRSPKVFIVNRGCHNFSAAKSYGELIFMTHGVINRYSVSEICRVFEEHLAHSTPEDYLLVSGMSTMLVVASGLLSAKHGCLNLLLYKNGKYLKRCITYEEPENG